MTDALKLSEAIKQLDASVTQTILFFDKLDNNDIPTLVKAFKQLKDNCGNLTDITKLVTTLLQDLSYEKLPEAFELHGFDSVKIGGYNFILNVRTNASIPLDKREVGFAWLKDNKLDNLIQETVNAKTLSSAINAYIEEHGKRPPEEAMSIHDQRYISVRKS